MKALLKAFCALLLVLTCLPVLAMALGAYDDDAMDAYCEAWTVYYKQNGPEIRVNSSFDITAWAHGSRKGTDSIAHMLSSSDKSPATFYASAEASSDDSRYTIVMNDEYLSETPKGLSLRVKDKTLVGAHSVWSTNAHYHEFQFDADDMMDVIDHLLSGGSATLQITSNQDKASVTVSKQSTPKLVEMLRRTRDGRMYGKKTSAQYKSSKLLPDGGKTTYTSTPKPTASSSSVPSSLKGSPLTEGDRNNRVLIVKQRMQALGYYRPTATVDDLFNSLMTERIKTFQQNNGLPQTGTLNERTLEKLYSSSPVKGPFYVAPTPTPKPEGRCMLVLPDNSYGQWEKVSGDKLKMRVQVKNESRYRTVKAFELYIYTEDIWGSRDPEKGSVYTCTTIKDVKPGKTVYSDYFVVPNRSKLYRVRVGVKQMRYDDGSIESISDSLINYFYWEP